MEARFGHDFSRVRVHADSRAARSAQLVGAQAYTIGSDIAFGESLYAPNSQAGHRLLAHELAHVVQQTGVGTGQSSQSDALEREAERAGEEATTRDAGAEVLLRAAPNLARQQLRDESEIKLLSDDELWAEIDTVKAWLKEHSMVELDYMTYSEYLGALESELATRPGGGPLLIPETREGAPSSSAGEEEMGLEWPGGWHTGGMTASGAIQGYDANVRITQYAEPAERLAQQILEDYQAGKIEHMEARVQAHQMRNDLLTQTREQLSPGGRSFSEAMKEEGKPLESLVDKYAREVAARDLLENDPELRSKYGLTTLDEADPNFNKKLFTQAVGELGESGRLTQEMVESVADTPRVSTQIIKAAGRPSSVITGVARFSRVAGPVGTAIGVGVSGYEIVNAPEGEKMHVAGREVSGVIGGAFGTVGGGLVAGWTASLVCGPGALVCGLVVTVVIVGGAAYAGGLVGEAIYENAPSVQPTNILREGPGRRF